MISRRKRIAVIGGGVTGLGAAWALRETAEVVLYEKAERFGGHAWTVDIDRCIITGLEIVCRRDLMQLNRSRTWFMGRCVRAV